MSRTHPRPAQNNRDAMRRELSLFIEELCCELCRFEHVVNDKCAPETVRVDREVNVGSASAFADIRISPPRQSPYYVEVKLDYTPDHLVRQLRRKYALDTPAIQQARKLILVVETRAYDNWKEIEQCIREAISPHLHLEVWDEQRLIALVAERFTVTVDEINEDNAQELRTAIDRTKGCYAFDGDLQTHRNTTLQNILLYHFDFWRLKQIRDGRESKTARDILVPGSYPGVVLIADLCSYTSYVRDTQDEAVIRHSLTTFYSRSRYQIRCNGGMLYQFVGDEVVGLFGIPDGKSGYVQDALDCARALIDLGNSVTEEWQRHIDRIPESGGLHVGIAVGDLQIVPERPFSRTYMAAVGDAINVATRLTAAAEPNEIIVSNSFYHLLDDHEQAMFEEAEPVTTRTAGRIKSWRYRPRRASDFEPQARV